MFFQLLFALLGLHALADYPLQGSFLSALKNPESSEAKWLGRGAWLQGLLAHGGIHGLFVGLATGSLTLGLAETALHILIDFAKVRRVINYQVDQGAHFICKILWAYLAIYVFHTHCPFLR